MTGARDGETKAPGRSPLRGLKPRGQSNPRQGETRFSFGTVASASGRSLAGEGRPALFVARWCLGR